MVLRSVLLLLLLFTAGCEKIPFLAKPTPAPPPQAGLWYHYGTLHHSIGEFQEATEAYQQAVKLQPDFFEAWYQLHLTLQAQGKIPEQIQALQEAVRLKPQSASVWNALSEAYASTGKNAEAIHARQQEEIAKRQPLSESTDLEAATQTRPNAPEVWLALAYHQLLTRPQAPDDYSPAAEKTFQHLTQLIPQEGFIWIHLGLAQIRRSDPAAAAIAQERITRVNVELFQKAVQLSPQDPLAHFFLGRAALWAQQPNEAVTALQKATTLDPAPSIAWYFLGEAYRLQNKPTEAIAAYQEALQRTPQRSEALYGLSMALASLHQLPEAITAFEKASAARPNIPDDSLASSRDIKRAQAQQALNTALQPPPPPQRVDPRTPKTPATKPQLLAPIPPAPPEPPPEEETLISLIRKTLEFPKDVRNWKKLFVLQEREHRLIDMTDSAMKIVALESTAANWSLLAYSFGLQDRREEEIKAYLKSLEKDPHQPIALQNLGLAFLEFKDPAQARETFEKWTKIDAENPEAWYHLGIAADEVKNFSQAESAYRKSLALDPKNPEAWLNLGAVYGETKKRGDEIEAYRKAVALDPNYASAWNNLSVALRQAGQIPQAEKARKEFERLKK